MPKKSSGSGASVEGYSFLTFIGHSEDEKSYMHLSTLPENLHIALIVILCKCFGLIKKCTECETNILLHKGLFQFIFPVCFH